MCLPEPRIITDCVSSPYGSSLQDDDDDDYVGDCVITCQLQQMSESQVEVQALYGIAM